MNPLSEALAARLDELLPNLVEIYKDFHRNPELSMQEFRTAKVVAEYLSQLEGVEVTTEIGVTGVVGVVREGVGACGRAECRSHTPAPNAFPSWARIRACVARWSPDLA